jgi:hypothetical protein
MSSESEETDPLPSDESCEEPAGAGVADEDGSQGSTGRAFRRKTKTMTAAQWRSQAAFDDADEIILQDGLLRFLLDAKMERAVALEKIRNIASHSELLACFVRSL